MAYCGPRGLPHSFFLGGSQAWTQGDRDKALAWQELDRQTCRGCGTRPDEWDPALGGSRQAWEFTPHVCSGCEAKEKTETRMQTAEYQGLKGLQIAVRRPRPKAAAVPATGRSRRG